MNRGRHVGGVVCGACKLTLRVVWKKGRPLAASRLAHVGDKRAEGGRFWAHEDPSCVSERRIINLETTFPSFASEMKKRGLRDEATLRLQLPSSLGSTS